MGRAAPPLFPGAGVFVVEEADGRGGTENNVR